jgi:hypothetical protein
VTITVDFGLTGGASTGTYLHIGDPVRGRIGTAAIGPEQVFETLSAWRLMGMSVQRTSSRQVGPVVEYNAATATVTLLNDDGALDPVNLTQPPPGVVMRIRKTHADVTYPLFRGYVTSWLPERRAPDHAVVVVQGVDGMDGIAGYRRAAVAPVGASEDTGARINRILDSVNWSTADRDIAVGDSTLQATTLEGEALDEIQDAAKAEVGEFYITADGKAFFRNRHALLTDARSAVSQATFGSDSTAGELPYVGPPGMSYDRTALINLVRATRVGGTEQVAQDAASRDRYRDHPHEEMALMLETDAEALSWAGYVLHQDRLPELRFTSITFNPEADPDGLWPQACGRQIGDRVTVVRRPPNVADDSREVFVRSIEHTYTAPASWETKFGLQPADKYSFFVIGHATQGRIGRNALAF